MRLRKRVKVLEDTVADLVRKNEAIQGRLDELEDEFDNLLKPVIEAFEGLENNAPTGAENEGELEYKDIINEWMNGARAK